MSNQVQRQQQTQQVAKFDPKQVRADVVSQLQKTMEAGFANLPKDYKISAMFAIEAMSNLDDIDRVQTTDITKALISMFHDGLDFRKKHVYFFVQNDKNSTTKKSLRYGMQYQGKEFIAKQQAGVYRITPVLVHEGDIFETHYENGVLIIDKHVPMFEGEIKGGYCVVEFEDKFMDIKYYPKSQLDKRRDKSRNPKGHFWDWEREMYEKTLINAVVDRIIETSANVSIDPEALYADRDLEFTTGRVVEDVEIIEQDEPTEIAQPKQQATYVEDLPPAPAANQGPAQATFMM